MIILFFKHSLLVFMDKYLHYMQGKGVFDTNPNICNISFFHLPLPPPPCSLQLWLVIVFKMDIYRLIMLSELFQRMIYDCNRIMLELLVCAQ